MAKHTVLYVEDEENDVFFMRKAFERTGVEHLLKTVGDGKLAIAYLSGQTPYADRNEHPMPVVVLLDLKLPMISGFEVLTWIRGQPQLRQLPVIIFSSSERPEDKKKAAELGASHYLTKPISGLEFAKVAQALQKEWLPLPGSIQ